MTLVEIPDNKIIHVWNCPHCDYAEKDRGGGATAHVSPDWYEHNGTPVCWECDKDMSYVKTLMVVD